VGVNEGKRSGAGGLTAGQADVLAREIDALPTLARVASRAIDLAAPAPGAPAPDEGTLGELLASDPALTASLLVRANALVPESTMTVPDALARLDDSAGLVAALSAEWSDADAPAGFDRVEFWRHCLAVACAAERLAVRAFCGVSREEAFACGLLHDLGKLALHAAVPKTYARALEAAQTSEAEIAELERKFVGVDHLAFGRRLAEHWRLPAVLREVLWLHAQPVESLPTDLANRRVVATVALADAIAGERGIGFSGSHAPGRTAEQLAAALTLPPGTIKEIRESLPGDVERHARRLGLDAVRAPTLAEVARANRTLGGICGDLRRGAHERSVGAKAFDLVRRFESSLCGNAGVAEALESLAQAAAEAAPETSGPVVAYGIDGEAQSVLMVRRDATRTCVWRTVALCARFDPAAAPAAPCRADEALSMLLGDALALADWLDAPAHSHQALVCGGRWIGGVVLALPPAAGAAGRQSCEVIRGLADVAAAALAIAQGREKAVRLGEQLAGASQVLARTQHALAEARTLAAIGELAAGAAHEMNNPLAVISGRAQLMAKRARSRKQKDLWNLIAGEAHRISDILTNLMEFASPAPPRPEAIEVSELLDRAAEAATSSDDPQAASAQVDIQVEAGVPKVFADGEQAVRALAELIRNAAATKDQAARIDLRAAAEEDTDVVLVRVTDFGAGMDAETASRAFTPFYSSQAAGRRAGMGLPLARRYVEINGGRLWLRSAEGQGTTAYVELPRARETTDGQENPNAA